jgi:hypothetical protein
MSVAYLNVEAVKQAALARPPGYLEEVMAAGTVDGPRLALPMTEYQRLLKKYRPVLAGCRPCCGAKTK